MDVEALRARYRPAKIAVLFIGEAPPAAGTFFYAANSQVYRYLRQALLPRLGGPADFLQAFADRGYFLDDLSLEPVDRVPLPQRGAIFDACVPQLAERLKSYRPLAIITILVRIFRYTEASRIEAGLDVPHYNVPFPGTGQQGNFLRRMGEIIPRLPE